MNGDHTFPIIEIFGPTLQGEGFMAGQVTHFIRFGGCTYRCSWCDSMYAVDPEEVKKNATKMTARAIVGQLKALGPVSCVTLSGGDPCIHKHMQEVINAIRTHFFLGTDVVVETQGAVFQPWLTDCDFVTLSPKGPSSKMKTDFDKLNDIIQALGSNEVPFVLKIVIFSEADAYYALDLKRRYNHVPMALQIGTPLNIADQGSHEQQMAHVRKRLLAATDELFNKLASDESFEEFFLPPAVRILPQIHTLIWGQERGK